MNSTIRGNRKQYWFVIKELTGREVKRKYVRSKLGIIWSILSPLLHMAIISLIFSYLFRRSIENFPVYYFCGHLIWHLFSESTNHAMTALVDNRTMLIKVKFPMSVFLISRVLTALVNLCFSLIGFVVILIFFRITPSWRMLLMPVIVILTTLFSMGLSYILATVYAFFADIKHLYGNVIMTLWFYFCALFYPVENLPELMQKIISYNPVFLYINALREIVLWGVMPSYMEWLKMIVAAAAMFFLGRLIFRKNRNKIMQVL